MPHNTGHSGSNLNSILQDGRHEVLPFEARLKVHPLIYRAISGPPDYSAFTFTYSFLPWSKKYQQHRCKNFEKRKSPGFIKGRRRRSLPEASQIYLLLQFALNMQWPSRSLFSLCSHKKRLCTHLIRHFILL